MKTRLYHARILTMEEDRDIFMGEVIIEDDRILEIKKESSEGGGAPADQAQQTYDLEIDCKGDLLMPGFKNAHTHSPMTFLRSFADDLPLQKWLNERVFPMEAKLDEKSVYEFARLAVLEYLTSGVTAVFDMYLMPDVMAKACMDTGMRCTLVSGLNNFTSSVKKVEDEYQRLNHISSLIRYVPGFHAEYTTSESILRDLSDLAKQLKAPVYTHLCETESEVAGCLERHGMTPPAYLDKLGLFENGGGGYHCVYMSEQDLEIFREKSLFVVTNSASNLKLASGIAPINAFLKRKIPVAIGTDGPASNNCLDMFREMFLVTGLAKYREKDAACLDSDEVLKMATINGALAMGWKDCDSLMHGKQADLILIDLKQPNMQPLHNLKKNLVYSGSKSNVRMTMIAGKIRYMDGEFFVGESPEDIYANCEKCCKMIFGENRNA